MQVGQVMTRDVRTCTPDDSLDAAARLLWDHDLGAVPVVVGSRVVGMVTDRDLCMAAYTQGRPLAQLPVSGAMSREAYSVRPDDAVMDAMRLMAERQVRRLPVVDKGKLVGLITLNDLAREAVRPYGEVDATEVTATLAAIGDPREAAGTRRPRIAMSAAAGQRG